MRPLTFSSLCSTVANSSSMHHGRSGERNQPQQYSLENRGPRAPSGPHTGTSGVRLPYIVCPLIITELIHHYMAGMPSGTGRSLWTEDRTSSSKGLICAMILCLIDGCTLINVSSPLLSGGGFWWSVKASNFSSVCWQKCDSEGDLLYMCALSTGIGVWNNNTYFGKADLF